MKYYMLCSLALFLLIDITNGYGFETECQNLVKKPYTKSPKFSAPDGTRGEGITIWIGGRLKPIPDTRPGCLPIPIRYNNIGALKTPENGPWPGQIGKDTKSHAIFGKVEQGITAWGMWIKNQFEHRNKKTAFSIMSLYAPPDDCVGSIGTPPNCPYGLNPTAEYAERVARAVGKNSNDTLNLDGTDCKEGRSALYALLSEIAVFEIGGNFCGKQDNKSRASCGIDKVIFDRAMDKVYGPVILDPCKAP